MRTVEIAGTGIRTSVLGYGTAHFGAGLRESERQRLLAAALDVGVTHFDTAPLYGDGTAEASLGRFLSGRRDRVTVTTKVGLVPPPGGALRRTGRAALRRVAPALRVAGARRTRDGEARKSIEESLRVLGTDHVDVLLIHECRPEDLGGELQAAVEDAVARGLALAGGITTTAEVPGTAGAFPQIVQTVPAVAPADRGVIVHSVLGAEIARVQARLSGLDPTEIAPLLLRLAVEQNSAGPVLFSSRVPAHIAGAAAAVDGDDPPDLAAVRDAVRLPSR